jgi:hypothetical protein
MHYNFDNLLADDPYATRVAADCYQFSEIDLAVDMGIKLMKANIGERRLYIHEKPPTKRVATLVLRPTFSVFESLTDTSSEHREEIRSKDGYIISESTLQVDVKVRVVKGFRPLEMSFESIGPRFIIVDFFLSQTEHKCPGWNRCEKLVRARHDLNLGCICICLREGLLMCS